MNTQQNEMVEQLYNDAKSGVWGKPPIMMVTWEQWRVIRDHDEFKPSDKVSLLIKGKFRDVDVMVE